MDKEVKMSFLRDCILLVDATLMVLTVILQICSYEPIRHFIMCIVIIFITNAVILFDVYLKDKAKIIIHIGCYVLFFANLVINLLKF